MQHVNPAISPTHIQNHHTLKSFLIATNVQCRQNVDGQNVDGQNVDNFGNIDQNVDGQNVDGQKNKTIINKTQPYISQYITLSTLPCIQSIHNPNTIYNMHFLFSAQSLT